LPVDDLPKLKQIFWRNNIKGFTPFLDVPVTVGSLSVMSGTFFASSTSADTTLIGTWVNHRVDLGDDGTFDTGVAGTNPWWHIASGGRWFEEGGDECVVGESLASRNNIHVGDLVGVSNSTSVMSFRVTGILSTGGSEDNAIVAPIAAAEKLAGQAGKYRRLMVSAVVKPDDDFDRRDHSKFTPEEYERWYCSAYIGSISLQIEQALPGVEARAVRQVAEGEGKILGRISVLLWIVTLAALIAAGLAVGSTAATSVLERQKEVGLMKALGASNSLVGAFFIGEQLLLALFGGGLGYAIGVLLARWLSITVFGVSSPARMIMLPVTLGLAIIVAVAGSIFPLRRASRFDPAPILRGE
jgi:putative ABC transport system permease protein